MHRLPSYIQWLRSRMHSILARDTNTLPFNTIPFFQPSFMPYESKKLQCQWCKEPYAAPCQFEDSPWLGEQFKHCLTSSTVSGLLSDRYFYLHQEHSKITFPSPFGQQASEPSVQADALPTSCQRIKNGYYSVTTAVQILLPVFPQYKKLPPPQSSIAVHGDRKQADSTIKRGQRSQRIEEGETGINDCRPVAPVDSLLAIITRYQKVPIPEPNTFGHKIRRQEKHAKDLIPFIGFKEIEDHEKALFSITTSANLEVREQGGSSAAAMIASEEMKSIRAACQKYSQDCIYNVDETLLSWKQALYHELSPEPKKQMTLMLCANSTGSDRLPVWIITPEKEPISLHRLNPELFGAVWHPSKSSSITYLTMREWLLSFYSHIGNQRSVILLLDNLAAHRKGVESIPPPSNIQIQWIPAGSTRLYQPLDQGIIHSLRNHYRQIWLKHLLEEIYNGNTHPIHTISPDLVVHWIVQIWKHRITNPAIQESFRKSTILANPRHPSLLTSGRNVPNPLTIPRR